MKEDKRGILPKVKKGKICDMVAEWTSKTKQPFISFEYFPPRTPEGVEKLHETIEVMAAQDPLFMDMTWGAGGATSELTLDLSAKSQARHDVMVNMHLTCTNQVKEKCDFGLNGAKAAGICNIVALRGDPPKGQEKWEVTEGGFACALDLIKYTREHYGDYFSLQVSGYPEGHPDVIITQLFYDFDVFKHWMGEIRAAGITVPVFPGIMPLNAYAGLKRMCGFCKTRIPPAMDAVLEKLKGDESKAEFITWGIGYMADLCKKLVASGLVPGLHFYSLNASERTFQILEALGFLKKPLDSPIAQMAITAGNVPPKRVKNVEASGDFKVADMSLSDFGRKEYDL